VIRQHLTRRATTCALSSPPQPGTPRDCPLIHVPFVASQALSGLHVQRPFAVRLKHVLDPAGEYARDVESQRKLG